MLMNGLKIIVESCVTDVLSIIFAVIVGSLFARVRKFQFVAWLVIYVIADDIVGLIPIVFHWNVGQWNWIGQIASLLLGLSIALRFFRRDETGLRLPRTLHEWWWTVGGIVVALLIAVGPALVGSGTHPSTETFAYEATLPGPVEELVFRGIGMALLLKAFSTGESDRRAEWIAVAVTAVWFTTGHVLHLDNGQFHVIWARIFDVFPMGTLYAIVRLKSRSLLGCILAHNAANTLVETIAAFRF